MPKCKIFCIQNNTFKNCLSFLKDFSMYPVLSCSPVHPIKCVLSIIWQDNFSVGPLIPYMLSSVSPDNCIFPHFEMLLIFFSPIYLYSLFNFTWFTNWASLYWLYKPINSHYTLHDLTFDKLNHLWFFSLAKPYDHWDQPAVCFVFLWEVTKLQKHLIYSKGQITILNNMCDHYKFLIHNR